MVDFQKPIPPYLNEKRNIVRLVLFASLFALVFINIYSPFGVEKWFSLTSLEFLTYSSLIILTGVLVVVISRIIMFQVCKRHLINIWQYLLWIFTEVFFMALFYALFQKLFLDDYRIFSDLVKASVRNTALVLLLPYSILWLYFSWRDKKEQIDRLEDVQAFSTSTRNMIPFYDDKGILKFSIKKENLLYLESAENYVSICYLNKGKVSKYLLRDTLKKTEENFSGTDIIRCHRSYMVNFDKVKVIRKDKDGLKLELDNPSIIDIPVSKTYVNSVMQTFSKYCQTNDAG
ncbi:MAG: LytTR family transcriptional regulator DNA-binding domain-containing protein [Bacteroidales bacterium]|nr:LytTR family transcriptional regulator DNA-binding domain-containing protein [Bacteroidales bacterium]MDP3001958.1 LytTR family transcriptional regulator DNA-binding domain-containing protein [Bacteroidales bacterium]